MTRFVAFLSARRYGRIDVTFRSVFLQIWYWNYKDVNDKNDGKFCAYYELFLYIERSCFKRDMFVRKESAHTFETKCKMSSSSLLHKTQCQTLNNAVHESVLQIYAECGVSVYNYDT